MSPAPTGQCRPDQRQEALLNSGADTIHRAGTSVDQLREWVAEHAGQLVRIAWEPRRAGHAVTGQLRPTVSDDGELEYIDTPNNSGLRRVAFWDRCEVLA